MSRPNVSLAKVEFESICEQLTKLELDVISVWATRDDEADGLERILLPLHAARRNLESAVSIATKSAKVQP